MARYAVKQPNGLYCYYSDSVHQVFAYNMTFEQLVGYNADRWKKSDEEAERDMRWMLENRLYTFEELLEDWVWHNEEIHEAMKADPTTVKPWYHPQQNCI